MEIEDKLEEQIVVGGPMVDPSVLDDVLREVDPGDFFHPAHETVLDAMATMQREGRPIDVITVSDHLARVGTLQRVGGQVYLHECVQSVPVPLNSPYYAQIVRDKARRRSLLAVGARLRDSADSGDDVAHALEMARKDIDTAALARQGNVRASMSRNVAEALDSLDQPISMRSPWQDLNRAIAGWMPGFLYVIGARPGVGKALDVTTEVPTPNGWTTMGELRTGDVVYAPDGSETRIIAHDPYRAKTYRLTFSDGTQVVADGSHSWVATSRSDRKAGRGPREYTTAYMAETVRCPGVEGRVNYRIDTTEPVEGREADLPLDPYTLGVWLGDGRTRGGVLSLNMWDAEHIVARCNFSDLRVTRTSGGTSYASCTRRSALSLTAVLRGMGMLGNKHIPVAYLRASRSQRLELLRGLMDTDGYHGSVVEFTSIEPRLAEGVRELANSLGEKARISEGEATLDGRYISQKYRVTWRPQKVDPFSLPRKSYTPEGARPSGRYLLSAEPCEERLVRCLTVENETAQYLVTRSWLPTHNTGILSNAALHAARANKGTVLIFSFEMSGRELALRMMGDIGNVDGERILHRSTRGNDDDRLADAGRQLNQLDLVIEDVKDRSVDDIRDVIRQYQSRGKVSFVGVDYLQIIGHRPGPRLDEHLRIGSDAQDLKNIATDLDVPVVALAQLNREIDTRAVKMPEMGDLKGSGGIEAAADVVALMHRVSATQESMGLGDSSRLEMYIGKNRAGPQTMVVLHYEGRYFRFTDLPPAYGPDGRSL